MKNLKTKTTLVIALFALSIFSINAQINLPKNNTVKNLELKKNQYKDLKLITGGNQGFVYQETANGGVGKKIPNAEIIFTSKGRTQKIKTNSYGRYKIYLQPGKYMVTVKHAGYKAYTTAPGFTVIGKKFSTFNIPLKRDRRYYRNRKGKK